MLANDRRLNQIASDRQVSHLRAAARFRARTLLPNIAQYWPRPEASVQLGGKGEDQVGDVVRFAVSRLFKYPEAFDMEPMPV